jgi:hypothetical protein
VTSAYGTFAAGPAESFAGGIGGTIMTAPSQTYVAGQASGTTVLGPLSGAGLICGGYFVGSMATHYSGCLCLGGEGVGYTTCISV